MLRFVTLLVMEIDMGFLDLTVDNFGCAAAAQDHGFL
jgi:hypothetical protein